MQAYLYRMFLVGFGVDLLLILAVNRIYGYPPAMARSLMGALAGGLYAAACLMPGFQFLGSWYWSIIGFLGMCGIAFGLNRTMASRCALLFLLTMALGGIVGGSENINLRDVAVCAVLLWLLCRMGFQEPLGGRRYVPVRITTQGKTHMLTALRDTGNTLTDPLTGESVLVAGREAAQLLLGPEGRILVDPIGAIASGMFPGMRLIPYHSVGCAGGLLPAMRFRDVMIGGNKRDALIAFAPNDIGRGEAYQMLTGGV